MNEWMIDWHRLNSLIVRKSVSQLQKRQGTDASLLGLINRVFLWSSRSESINKTEQESIKFQDIHCSMKKNSNYFYPMTMIRAATVCSLQSVSQDIMISHMNIRTSRKNPLALMRRQIALAFFFSSSLTSTRAWTREIDRLIRCIVQSNIS